MQLAAHSLPKTCSQALVASDQMVSDVVREALLSAESALLTEDFEKVEDKAEEVARLIRSSSEELKLHGGFFTADLRDFSTVQNHVCEMLTENVDLLEQTLFTLVPPLTELTFELERVNNNHHVAGKDMERVLNADNKERLAQLLRRISTSGNAREAVLLFNQIVPIFKR